MKRSTNVLIGLSLVLLILFSGTMFFVTSGSLPSPYAYAVGAFCAAIIFIVPNSLLGEDVPRSKRLAVFAAVIVMIMIVAALRR